MTTSEPTAAEIVRALRFSKAYELFDHTAAAVDIDLIDSAADRLEQLERENAELRKVAGEGIRECAACTVQNATEIKKLTARAEKAEAERDAAKYETFHNPYLLLREHLYASEENIRKVSNEELFWLTQEVDFINIGNYAEYPNLITGEVGIYNLKIIILDPEKR